MEWLDILLGIQIVVLFICGCVSLYLIGYAIRCIRSAEWDETGGVALVAGIVGICFVVGISILLVTMFAA